VFAPDFSSIARCYWICYAADAVELIISADSVVLIKRSNDMKFLKSIAIAGLLSCSYAAFAMEDMTCPSVEQIQKEGVQQIQLLGFNVYIAYNIDVNYGTPYHWNFYAGYLQADSEDAAKDLALQLINNIQSPANAEIADDELQCSYDVGDDNVDVVAVRRLGEGVSAPMSISRYLRKSAR
jgi:hypothetical protein